MSDVKTIAPVALAKKLGIPPQKIYGLIKSGRVKPYPGVKSQEVIADEVKEALVSVKPRGRPGKEKTEEGTVRSPTKRGDVVSWPLKNRGVLRGRRVVQTTATDDTFTHMQPTVVVGDRPKKVEMDRKREVVFTNLQLLELIDQKIARIENPWNLLKMVEVQWTHQGKKELAQALQVFIDDNGPSIKPDVATEMEKRPEEELAPAGV